MWFAPHFLSWGKLRVGTVLGKLHVGAVLGKLQVGAILLYYRQLDRGAPALDTELLP